MFIAHKDNYIPSFFDGEFNFSALELPVFLPWFICEVAQFEEDSEEAICTSTYLIGDIDKLSEFAGVNKIDKTYIVSPGYMTKSKNWSLMRLKSVAQATYRNHENESRVYRFEIESGKFIDLNLSGLNIQDNALKFETILNFNY